MVWRTLYSGSKATVSSKLSVASIADAESADAPQQDLSADPNILSHFATASLAAQAAILSMAGGAQNLLVRLWGVYDPAGPNAPIPGAMGSKIVIEISEVWD